MKDFMNTIKFAFVAALAFCAFGAWAETPVASITTGAGTTNYGSVQEAVDAATAGQTVKLLVDRQENIAVAEDDNLTLDLNGHVLKGDETSSVIYIATNGALTVTDSDKSTTHYFKVLTDPAQSTLLESMRTDYACVWVLDTEATSGTPMEDLTEIPTNGACVAVKGGLITGGGGTKRHYEETTFGVGGPGESYFGGGIFSCGALTLDNATVCGNTMKTDGGSYGFCAGAGVCIDFSGTCTLTNGAVICGNSYYGFNGKGGGIASHGPVTIAAGCSISYNAAGDDNGGIETRAVDVAITGSEIRRNVASGCGGLTFIGLKDSGTSDLIMTDCIVEGNRGQSTGGIFAKNGNFTFSGGRVVGNLAETGEGGGIYCIHEKGGSTTIIGATIAGNWAGSRGGGIRIDSGTNTLTDVVIADNYAGYNGGGGVCSLCTLVANNVTLTNNQAALDSGGAIYAYMGASIALTNCLIAGNAAAGDGGGVYVHSNIQGDDPGISSAELTNVKVLDNTAKNGGGIGFCGSSRLFAKGCLVKGNRASGAGGGIYKDGAGQDKNDGAWDKVVLIDTAIVGNAAETDGGGIDYSMCLYTCLAEGTLVRMADGTEMPIENVKEGDLVATFDHEGGTNSSALVYYACKGEGKATPFTLEFEGQGGADGVRALPIVGCHDLLEQGSRKYVTITAANVGQYIGKKFYGADGAWHTLTNVTMGTEKVWYYSIYAAQHQNVYANGLLTVCDDVDYLLNIYELDENLKADAAQLAADVAQYGYFSYDEAATYGVSREWYDAGNTKYLNVAIGKQLVSKEYAEQLFASTGKAVAPTTAEAAPKATPKLMSVSPKLLSASVSDPTLDDATVGYLTLGHDVVVTNNFVGSTTANNISLHTGYYGKDKKLRNALVVLAESHSGIRAGVTLEWTSGQFTDVGANPDDVACFWDDTGTYAVWHDSGNFLKLDDGSQIMPPAVANTTFEIFTNGFSAGQVTTVGKDTPAEVVYTAEAGYYFAGGETAVTASVDTSATLATMTPPAAPKKPSPIKYLAPVYKGTDGNPTNGIAYWTTNKVDSYTVVTSAASQVIWGAEGATNWFVVTNDVQIDNGVVCTGHVHLILCEGAKLTVDNVNDEIAGIATDASGSFTVYGQPDGAGELEVTSGDFGAGIGGGRGVFVSGITINGGTVTATGVGNGAGIGGGDNGTGSYITINGGQVTATCDVDGAGIGGGYEGVGSHITINGGTVTATAVGQGSGIGCGSKGASSYITINGGTVTAKSGSNGAGIGCGWNGSASNIAINGGTVTATGGENGAGIGGGGDVSASGITINGGTVTATGGENGAGIGGGYGGSGFDVKINGGTVTATGGFYGAGIGGGAGSAGSNIIVNAGTVTAISGSGGAGIGGGAEGVGQNIEIGQAKVFVCGPAEYFKLFDMFFIHEYHPDVIGCGGSCTSVAEGVVISPLAKICFNLTGYIYKTENSTWTWTDELAPMPEDFDGFVIMTPETPTNHVLVGGCTNWTAATTFALTNAVTGATGTIEVNGAKVTFAERLLGLPLADDKLALNVYETSPILAKPTPVAHTTMEVFTNGVISAETSAGSGEWYAWSNDTAYVVYTAKPGYVFEGGVTEKTIALDTTVSPAVNKGGEVPVVIALVEYTYPIYVGGVASNGIERWDTNTCYSYTVVTSAESQVTWGMAGVTNWFVVTNADVQIDGGVVCKGYVNLILCEGAKLVVTNLTTDVAGIATDPDGSFTVYGQPDGAGELESFVSGAKAAIGGGRNESGRNITINGGRVTAYGHGGGTGIGGGYKADGSNITINGGIVYALGSDGAGIGGGPVNGVGSYITINGGEVTATNLVEGCAIGGGCDGHGYAITINGGHVTATSSPDGMTAAAIGGSGNGSGYDIRINGGEVAACGSCAIAAIGGGARGCGSNIVISAGHVAVRSAWIVMESQYYAGELIGSGAAGGPSKNNYVSPEANVLFNLTSMLSYDTEEIVDDYPMPASFDGFVIMTSATQEWDRVLVGGVGAQGLSALPTFALTNAVTGATGTIEVNGAKVPFAERLLELPCADNALTLKATEYSMINPPTEIANTTAAVYTNDAEVAVGAGIIVTNGTPAYVVYTADDGFAFADGSTSKTNQLNTTVNPAVIVGDLPDAPEPLVVAEVIVGTETNQFKTLNAAWEAARQAGTTANPATIRLLRDIKLTNTLETVTAPLP